MRSVRVLPLLLLSILLVLASRPAAACVDRGRPCCDYCRMILVESGKGFGGVIETVDGRRLIFDSTECMAAFVLTHGVPANRVRAIYSVDHDAPDHRLVAERARYLHSHMESPMGMGLSAHASLARARAERRRHPGEILDWDHVKELVRVVWYRGKKM